MKKLLLILAFVILPFSAYAGGAGGIVPFASDAETVGQSSTNKALSPANLSAQGTVYASTSTAITDFADSTQTGSLAAQITAINGANKDLVLPSRAAEYPVRKALTISSNIAYKPQKGAILDNTDALDYAWTSATGSEYLYPITINRPSMIYIDGTALTEGTVGELAAGEWGWSSGLYVRMSDGSDPTAQDDGDIVAVWTITINGPPVIGDWQAFDSLPGGVVLTNPPVNGVALEVFGGLRGVAGTEETGRANMLALHCLSFALDLHHGANGGIIKFGPGTYPIYHSSNSTIVDVSGIILQGAGKEITILDSFSNEVLSDIDLSLFRTYANNSISVYDLTFDNSDYANDGTIHDRGKLINEWWDYEDRSAVTRNNRFDVERCKFICNAAPLTLEFAEHVVVRDCEFYQSGHDIGDVVALIVVETDYAEIVHNYVEQATRPESLEGVQNTINLRISSGVVRDNYVEGSQYTAGILIERLSGEYTGKIIATNNIVNIVGADVDAGIYFHNVVNCIASGNLIMGGDNGDAKPAGILIGLESLDEMSPPYDSFAVSDNYINGTTYGVKISVDKYGYGNINIKNNNITDTYSPFYLANFNSAPASPLGGFVDIEGNLCSEIKGYSTYPVYVYHFGTECQKLIFRNNQFLFASDFDSSTSADRIFFLSAASGRNPGNIEMENNSIYGTTVPKIKRSDIKAIFSGGFIARFPLAKTIQSTQAIDLDAGATTRLWFAQTGTDNLPLELTLVYTEASSADTGVDVLFLREGTSGDDVIYTYTSEASKSIGYSATFDLTNFDWGYQQAYDSDHPFFIVKSACTKTGAGKIVAGIKYVDLADM